MEALNDWQQDNVELYAIIRYVEPGEDDYDEIYDLYEKDPQEAIEYLSQWDDDECEIVAKKPRIANYDEEHESNDGVLTLLYNNTIGGCFLLYRDASDYEYDWYKENNDYM